MPTSPTARSVGVSAVTGLEPTARAAEVIDTLPKTSPPCITPGMELRKYALRPRPGSRVYKIRIYTDSVVAYQKRAEQNNPLKRDL
jgi:hypothetical protein